MTVEQSFRHKLHSLIYPKGTPKLNGENSTYLGTTSPYEMLENLDDFYRLWFTDFNDWTKWFGPFRSAAEGFFKNDRFVSFAEYQEVFKDRAVTTDLQDRYPIYKLLGISNTSQRQRFVNSYSDTAGDYLTLMKRKNPKLWQLYRMPHQVRYHDKEKVKHAYAVGRIGSGKTELMKHCLLQEIQKGDSCVILMEPNGDFAQQVARQKDLPPERLVYVTFDINGRTVRINPFELIKGTTDKEVEIQTQIIRGALNSIFEDDGDKLTPSQHAIIEACLDVVVRQKGTLKDLLRFMNDDANSDLIAAGKNIPKHQEFFETMFSNPSFKVSKFALYKKLSNILNLSSVSEFLCGETSINLHKAIKDKKIIVFNISKSEVGDYAAKYISKMMLALIQSLVFQRASIPEADRQPLVIYIDEVQDAITANLKTMFEQCRKYNSAMFIASQVLQQNMSPELTKVILSSTSVKFAGANEYRTLKAMSQQNYADVNDLRKLSVGQFFCRIGEGQGFILNVPDTYLKDKTCKSDEEWETVLAGQTSRYYRPIEKMKTTKRSTPPNKLKPDQLDGGIITPKY